MVSMGEKLKSVKVNYNPFFFYFLIFLEIKQLTSHSDFGKLVQG